ncbi:DUF742 domain-containing protein [Streptomyces sp. NPDC096012]|uniref:DUF742 domain-containing protein n=1 Tax=Streptomyces sp. NPDC096012 TaxID=3155684 RepID=UPI00336ADF13
MASEGGQHHPGSGGAGSGGRPSAIRPFLLTAGRVAGSDAVAPLPIETQVVTTSLGLATLETLAFEHRDIVAVCRRPQSLAEVAAKLHLHLNVVRVLATDLRAHALLAVYVPSADASRDVSVLQRVIDGLRGVAESEGIHRDSQRD